MSARPMPPYLCRQEARGRTVWYYRKGKGKRVRIRGEFGSEEFARNYQAAVLGQEPQKPPRAGKSTLAWLIACYLDSSAWTTLSEATRNQRQYHFNAVLKRAGDARLEDITKKTIQTAIEDRSKTPFLANDFLKAMRGLFKWAKLQEHIQVDPTEGVRGFSHKTEGFHVWTEEEIARFEARWAVGTRERLALAILLYTGLRRGDAAMFGRQHCQEGIIRFRTAKTGQQITIPLLPELARIIEATPTGGLTLISQADGRPMSKECFGHWFGEACRAAGVPGTAHGLRKALATRMANAGATGLEIGAALGHAHGSRQTDGYTRAADRVRLARAAMDKLRK